MIGEIASSDSNLAHVLSALFMLWYALVNDVGRQNVAFISWNLHVAECGWDTSPNNVQKVKLRLVSLLNPCMALQDHIALERSRIMGSDTENCTPTPSRGL